jgi:hypothetical protein
MANQWKTDDEDRRYQWGQVTYLCPTLAHGRDFDGTPLQEEFPPPEPYEADK